MNCIVSTTIQEHQDEIVSVAFYPPYELATASFDGEIVIWSLTTQKPTKKFRLRDKSASTVVSKDVSIYLLVYSI